MTSFASNPDYLSESLSKRLTDANRPAILAALLQETGFSRLDLFNSCAKPQERVRVLSMLLSLAHGGQNSPVVTPQGVRGAFEVRCQYEAGSIPLAEAQDDTLDAAMGALEAIQDAVRTKNARVSVQVFVTVNLPEPKP